MIARSIVFPQEIGLVVDELRRARDESRSRHETESGRDICFPSRQALKRIARELSIALFPLRLGPPELTARNENAFIAATLESTLSQLAAQIGLELASHGDTSDPSIDEIVGLFAAQLPAIRRALDRDLAASFAADPAARSVDEVLITYPSFTAVIYHRIAHQLQLLNLPLVARLIAEIAHAETGVDIHPGARIGDHFFIDHGTGVVIGETAVVGDRVRLYQGVTLGGDPDLADRKGTEPRHPVIGDDVVVYPNASIIGYVTIGARSRIGGNVWLRRDVPPDSLVEAPSPSVQHR